MSKVNIGPLSLNVVTQGAPGAPALDARPSARRRSAIWDDIAPAAGEKFFVVRFDARGHGGSDVPARSL